MSGDIALYVHMPFCRRKCRYCSFISYEHREKDIPAYIETMGKEITLRAAGKSVTSVYLGGGTPSLIPSPSLQNLFDAIRKTCNVVKDAEISMEANPGTVNAQYFKDLKRIGINRLSLGVQSFNDNDLAMLGRIHTAKEAKEAVDAARQAGFDNLNLDLIYGLPDQTGESWEKTLEQAIELKPEHLSLYALTLEEETPMQRLIDGGKLPPVDPDLAADLYEMAEETLGKHGYVHYEISNWARPGKECRHNLVYWHNMPYLGIGAAAHSCLNGHRLANPENLDEYMIMFRGNGLFKPEMDEVISPELELAESIILGLRLGEGVSREAIQKRFGVDVSERYGKQIQDVTEAGLLEQNDGQIRLTRRGRFLSNEVFWRFLPEQ